MLNHFQETPKGPVVKALVSGGQKAPHTENRPPIDRDLVDHLHGRAALGVLVDKALSLDLDHHGLDQITPLLETLKGLALPVYYGPGTTRGSRVWVFTEAGDLEPHAQALADLAEALGYSPCEPYPKGRKPIILPFFGALNGDRRPLYGPDGREIHPEGFNPARATRDHLRRVRLAVALFLEALSKRPENRHDTAMAFLNVADRVGVADLLAVLMGTEALFKAWGLEDTRTLETWRKELYRLLEAATNPNGPKRGLPFLKEMGYELPQEVLEGLPVDLRYPEPLPLYRHVGEPEPYPVDALGPLAEVVKETARIVQVPLPMAANSFLAAASYATQGLVDVHMDGRVHPTSLYFLTVGDSGDRKTQTDRVATRPIWDWVRELRPKLRQLRAEYEAEKDRVEAMRRRVRTEKGRPPEEVEEELKALVPPSPPWGGVVLVTDPTIEALVRTLATGWPSVGLFANEAGVFLGGWSLSDDQRLKTYSVLSAVWDGQALDRVRVGEGHTQVFGRRLAVHLMAQPDVAKALINDRLAQNQGLLGRFLMAYPKSLAGTRTYIEADPTDTPAFHGYHATLTELLRRTTDRVLQVEDKDEGLHPDPLKLTREAKRVWVDYYHDVEARLPNEDLQLVRPLANKLAEQALRLAGVLSLIQDPGADQIPEEVVEWGVVLAEYYLREAQRLAGGYRVPEYLRQAEHLLNWLKGYLRQKGRREFYLAEVYNNQVSGANTADRARSVLRTLERHGYIIPASGTVIDGRARKEAWEINPRVWQEEGGQDDPGPGGPGGLRVQGGPYPEHPEHPELPSQTQVPTLKSTLNNPEQPGTGTPGTLNTPTPDPEAHPPVQGVQGGVQGPFRVEVCDNEGTSGSSGCSGYPDPENAGKGVVKSLSTKTPYRYLPHPTPSELADALSLLMAHEMVGVDLETTGLDPHTAQVRLISFGYHEGGQEKAVLVEGTPEALQALRPLFEEEKGPVLVGHNLRFDLSFLMRHGVYPRGDRLWDTGLAHQILTASGRMPALRELVPGLDKTLQRSDWTGALTLDQLEYAARDALVVLGLYREQVQEIRRKGLHQVAKVEMHALPAIAWMGLSGVPFSPDLWREELERAREAEARALDRLRAFADINWRSSHQVLRTLRAHGLEISDTREETLAVHKDHPLVKALLAFREASKRVSAFGQRWLQYVHPKTGRIHPDWKQIGAETGRMACANPNLQQVPRDAIRKAFRAPKGRVLIKADYSQIELRLAAAIAPDPIMARAFRSGQDLHTLTAQRVLGKAEVSREDRQLAKALNFGLLYGMGAESLRSYSMANYGIHLTVEEAQRFREAFFRLYPGLRMWHRRTPEGKTEVRTLLGRRRVTDRYTEKLNTPVQGSGADGLKLALALLYERRHEAPGAFPVLAVHDEIVVEAPEETAFEVAEWVANIMREAMMTVMAKAKMAVPVEVEADVFLDWGITPLVDDLPF